MKIIASLVLYKHRFEDISKTLNSLINEDSINTIIIVDNGNHCDWLTDFSHEKIDKIYLDKNFGFGSGHNSVFKRYKKIADYFLICNPDIYFEKGEIDKLLEFSEANTVDLCIPKILYPDGTLQHSCKLLPTPFQLFMRRFFIGINKKSNSYYELHDADYNKAFFAPSISGCCMFLSRKAIKFTQGFDPRFFLYLEDIDLSRRICQADLSVTYCPYSIVFHEAQRKSYSNYKFLFYHLVSAIKYFNKWGWFIDGCRTLLNQKCLDLLPRKNKNN